MSPNPNYLDPEEGKFTTLHSVDAVHFVTSSSLLLCVCVCGIAIRSVVAYLTTGQDNARNQQYPIHQRRQRLWNFGGKLALQEICDCHSSHFNPDV